MKKTLLLSTLVSLGCLSSLQTAQANWLDKGLEILNNTNSSSQTSSSTTQNTNFSTNQLESAFREALSIGSKTVIAQIGSEDGFNLDPKIHIPLPSSLNTLKSGLAKFGMGAYAEELELTLNRAAEEAMPETKQIFLNAIQSMSFEDVKTIYNGPENSATQYLQKTTTDALKSKIAPIIDLKLNSVGAITAYEGLTSTYRQKYPFLPNVKANLQDHVMQKALDGMFYYLGQEEAKIRAQPLQYGSDLLIKVFSK